MERWKKLSISDKYGRRKQISFRVGPCALERLEQVADLFHMKASEYAKALLYAQLGVFNEPPDRRTKKQRKMAKTDIS